MSNCQALCNGSYSQPIEEKLDLVRNLKIGLSALGFEPPLDRPVISLETSACDIGTE